MLKISESGGSVLLPVKIVPGASRARYLGEWQGRARIAVAAPPQRGKANEALIKLLSKLLGVDRRLITVIVGHTTPLKTIRIDGIRAAALQAALESHQS